MTKETIYTGDYGLSDCLFVNEEVLDFAESFFKKEKEVKSVESSITKDDKIDFPF